MVDKGKDISDPARGIPETRGGENPSDWTGPLPENPVPPAKVPAPAPEKPLPYEISEVDT